MYLNLSRDMLNHELPSLSLVNIHLAHNFLASLEYDLGFISFWVIYFTIGYMFGERFTEFVL